MLKDLDDDFLELSDINYSIPVIEKDIKDLFDITYNYIDISKDNISRNDNLYLLEYTFGEYTDKIIDKFLLYKCIYNVLFYKLATISYYIVNPCK
jgi:hypothetical protein